MHLGLIGGSGHAASVVYYKNLVGIFGQADVPLQLTIQHADMKRLTENAVRLIIDAQTEVFAAQFKLLKRAGCDIAGITALTRHFCLPLLQSGSELPILSARSAIDAYCVGLGIGRLGLLGSPSVLQTLLFGLLDGVEVVVPREESEGVGNAYAEIATTGTCSTEHADLLITAGAEMMQVQKADAILLAGMDLGLAYSCADPSYPVIDALARNADAFLEVERQGARLSRWVE